MAYFSICEKTLFEIEIRRQHGRFFSLSDSQTGGPMFDSRFVYLLVVSSSNPRPFLLIANWCSLLPVVVSNPVMFYLYHLFQNYSSGVPVK